MTNYPQPVATLIAVNGREDGDFLVPFTGAPAAGGETHLSPWQAADLLARGYRWAHEWEPGAPEPDAATLAAIAAAAPTAPAAPTPTLADELGELVAAATAHHDAAMAATEATLARIKALVNELAELG